MRSASSMMPPPGGSPMASRRSPSPALNRNGSLPGSAARRGEDSLDAEVRRVTPMLPVSSPVGSAGAGAHRNGPGSAGSGQANVFVVSHSRPATGTSSLGGTLSAAPPPPPPQARGSGMSAAAPGSPLLTPGSAKPALPSFGRRASGGAEAISRGGTPSSPATAMQREHSMAAHNAAAAMLGRGPSGTGNDVSPSLTSSIASMNAYGDARMSGASKR